MTVASDNEYHAQRPDCKLHFEQILDTLSKHERKFDDRNEFEQSAGINIATLATRLDEQSKSLNRLASAVSGTNKTLIGIFVTLMFTLVGFFIWYVQQLGPGR